MYLVVLCPCTPYIQRWRTFSRMIKSRAQRSAWGGLTWKIKTLLIARLDQLDSLAEFTVNVKEIQ